MAARLRLARWARSGCARCATAPRTATSGHNPGNGTAGGRSEPRGPPPATDARLSEPRKVVRTSDASKRAWPVLLSRGRLLDARDGPLVPPVARPLAATPADSPYAKRLIGRAAGRRTS